MSKHEPRSEDMKLDASQYGWKLKWAKRNYKLYLSVDIKRDVRPKTWIGGWVTEAKYDEVKVWVKKYYPRAELTSWKESGGTFLVQDVIGWLKK